METPIVMSKLLTRRQLLSMVTVAAIPLLAACAPASQSPAAPAAAPTKAPATAAAPASGAAKHVTLDASKIGPGKIIGLGPNSESPASPDDVKLSDQEMEQLRAKHFKVAIMMADMRNDWTKLQSRSLTENCTKLGMEVIGPIDANMQPDKAVAQIENEIQVHPDGIFIITPDDTACAPALMKIQPAGIKLVLLDNVGRGMKYPQHYSSMISADSQGNGWCAAQILAAYVPQGGTVGGIFYDIDFFVTRERYLGFTNWLKQNRPDVQIKGVPFLKEEDVYQVTLDFLTVNPKVDGLFAVWDLPALAGAAAARAAGLMLPITCIDLGIEASLEIAKDGYIKGEGAQQPYDQGTAESLAMAKALLGQPAPAWIGVNSKPVVQSNILKAYEEVWHEKPPAQLVDACKQTPTCTVS